MQLIRARLSLPDEGTGLRGTVSDGEVNRSAYTVQRPGPSIVLFRPTRTPFGVDAGIETADLVLLAGVESGKVPAGGSAAAGTSGNGQHNHDYTVGNALNCLAGRRRKWPQQDGLAVDVRCCIIRLCPQRHWAG